MVYDFGNLNVVLRQGLMKAGALLLQKMVGLYTRQVPTIDLALHAVTGMPLAGFLISFGASRWGVGGANEGRFFFAPEDREHKTVQFPPPDLTLTTAVCKFFL